MIECRRDGNLELGTSVGEMSATIRVIDVQRYQD